jgi:hypothetical protein
MANIDITTEYIKHYKNSVMGKQKIIEDALKKIATIIPITFKIKYMKLPAEIKNIAFNEENDNKIYKIFNVEEERGIYLRHSLWEFIHTYNEKQSLGKEYEFDVAYAMQKIVEMTETYEELFYLTFALGALCGDDPRLTI